MDDWAFKTAVAISVIAMILSSAPLTRASTFPAPAIWLMPEALSFYTNQNHVGDRFNVTVWINTTDPSYAWQVQVNFDTSQINAVRAEYTGEGKSIFFSGHETVAVSPAIDNATGFVMYGESLIGEDQVAAGSNSVFWVEFMIMAEPPENEILTSLVSVDSNPDCTFILDSDSNSVPSVSVGFAVYTLGPVRSAIWLMPEALSFYTNQNHVGDRFNVTVWINTTEPSYAWQVQVNFDTSQINAVRAEYTGEGKSIFFTGHDTIQVSSVVDDATGFVMHGESLIGEDQVAAGSNSVFWVEFMIMAEPAENETLDSLISVDSNSNNTFILDPNLKSFSNVDLGSAAYTLGPVPPVRDVALTSLSLSSGHAKQGDNITVTVVVLNNGTASETFDVSLTFDSTLFVVVIVFQLAAGETSTLYFEWNTTSASYGSHTITASATVAPSDLCPSNNSTSKNLVIVAGSADANGDGRVDMLDIAIVAHAFGTHEGDPRWNPVADISSLETGNPDGQIDMFDIAMVSHAFGTNIPT